VTSRMTALLLIVIYCRSTGGYAKHAANQSCNPLNLGIV
jgi:hypothetical protein